MSDGNKSEDSNELVTSYLRVRTAIGALAIILPILLVGSAWLFEAVDFVPSISEFFYTPMREALVGTIGAIAVFLISYKGYPMDPVRAETNTAEKWFTDRRVSYAAAIGALCVALFPSLTTIKMELTPKPLAFVLLDKTHAGYIHSAGAGLFFAALAVFCFSNFRRGGAKTRILVYGMSEDRFYWLCGWILSLCIAALLLVMIANRWGSEDLKTWLESKEVIFWIETIGLVTFAAAWLTKGKARSTVPKLMAEMVRTKRD